MTIYRLLYRQLNWRYNPFIVDEIYSVFPDREDTQFVLHMMGYNSMTTGDFRKRGLTDNEIRKLVIESKKITIEQVKDLINRSDLFLKRCVKCGKHVFERKGVVDIMTFGFESNEAIVKKGVIYFYWCWNK